MDKNKFCTECGSKLPKVAKFCEECGVELALVQMKTTEEPKAEVAEPKEEEAKVPEIEINEEPEEKVIPKMKPKNVKKSRIRDLTIVLTITFLILYVLTFSSF